MTAASRNILRSILPSEVEALAAQVQRLPHSAYYRTTNERTGQLRTIPHAQALEILHATGRTA